MWSVWSLAVDADPRGLLTAHEWRVASAVGQGATNKAVARELSVSTKTVEYHLGNVYRKLHGRH